MDSYSIFLFCVIASILYAVQFGPSANGLECLFGWYVANGVEALWLPFRERDKEERGVVIVLTLVLV